MRASPPIQRFHEKIAISETGCWLWTSSTDRGGYALLWVVDRRRLAHRFAYEHFVGPIPPGLTLDHVCHSNDLTCAGGSSCIHRRCVNPDHLEVTEMKENVLRGRAPSAINARKTHCKRGHEFTAANTYVPPSGGRICRACNRAWRIARNERMAA